VQSPVVSARTQPRTTAPIRWQTDAEIWEIALQWLIFCTQGRHDGQQPLFLSDGQPIPIRRSAQSGGSVGARRMASNAPPW